MNYRDIAFTPEVKSLQERFGSRTSYARTDGLVQDGLTENEIYFISLQDNFYMSTVSESGFPYIQFRGGPKGFLKVLDKDTLAFLDFSGNKQYITTGNLATNNKAALFLLDQASKYRLKLFAEARIMELEGNEDLVNQLSLEGYKYKAQRIIILKVRGYDWNCSQHITERYTLEEIREHFEAQHDFIEKLRQENADLKKKLKANQLRQLSSI